MRRRRRSRRGRSPSTRSPHVRRHPPAPLLLLLLLAREPSPPPPSSSSPPPSLQSLSSDRRSAPLTSTNFASPIPAAMFERAAASSGGRPLRLLLIRRGDGDDVRPPVSLPRTVPGRGDEKEGACRGWGDGGVASARPRRRHPRRGTTRLLRDEFGVVRVDHRPGLHVDLGGGVAGLAGLGELAVRATFGMSIYVACIWRALRRRPLAPPLRPPSASFGPLRPPSAPLDPLALAMFGPLRPPSALFGPLRPTDPLHRGTHVYK